MLLFFMSNPNAEPMLIPRSDTPERHISPEEAIKTSNRDVITGIYKTANEPAPPDLIQYTNGSRAYIDYTGIIRLVYDTEREEAEANPQALAVNPAVDKLSELVANGRVAHTRVPETLTLGFRPADDSLYEAIDKAWGPIYAFTDVESGEAICYSLKVDTHTAAETVLVSPAHVDLGRADAV